jgi:molybdate/tungstate transport system substrate-binding protein
MENVPVGALVQASAGAARHLPKLTPCNEIRHMRPLGTACLVAALVFVRPGQAAATPRADTVVVFTAASLAVPIRAALDSFARRTGTVVQQENGASLELARRITELGRIPDVIALADQEVFPLLLVPRAASWYVRFARNRMVVAFTGRSAGAAGLTSANWYEVLTRPGVRVGRSDPRLAPVGYRALLMYRLAEVHYRRPGLASRLEARTPPALIRPNASELVALLQAGELDYIVDYESLARANRLRFVTLPPEIDLGDPARAGAYASATVRVARRTDTATYAGAPIVYAATVPRAAPHPAAGLRFLSWLLSPAGQAVLRAHAVDALRAPEMVGDSVPPALGATRR